MSFSSMVKKEIYKASGGDRHCRVAMLAALINGAARVTTGTEGFAQAGSGQAGLCVHLKTENALLAKKFYDIVKHDFMAKAKVHGKRAESVGAYELSVTGEDAAKLLNATGLWTEGHGYVRRVNRLVTKSDCCKRAYLAGTLLACGYLSNPNKAYHCEFIAEDESYAAELSGLWEGFGLKPRSITRKGRHGLVVYFKDSEQIADILNITGAHTALMRFENIRIRKDVDNKINRSVNCDSANLDKAISAAVQQIESINLIQRIAGLSSLPSALYETARARLEYPEVSLKEIGEMLNPPISKSGVNHRLRKIKQIADNIQNHPEV